MNDSCGGSDYRSGEYPQTAPPSGVAFLSTIQTGHQYILCNTAWMNDEMQWRDLKKILLATRKGCIRFNGIDICKNCGMDYKELCEHIEMIFNVDKKKSATLKALQGKRKHTMAKAKKAKVVAKSKKKDMDKKKGC